MRNIDSEVYKSLTSNRQRFEFLIQYATLAPSSRNLQRWKFLCKESSIEMHLQLSDIEPYSELREAYISIGCAYENLRIAAEHFGLQTSYTLEGKGRPYIEVTFESITPIVSPLFLQIGLRFTPHTKFIKSSMTEAEIKQLYDSVTYCDLYLTDNETICKEMNEQALLIDLEDHASRSFIEYINPMMTNLTDPVTPLLEKLNQFASHALGKTVMPLGEPTLFGVLGTSFNSFESWVEVGRDLERLYLTCFTGDGWKIRPQGRFIKNTQMQTKLSMMTLSEAQVVFFIGKTKVASAMSGRKDLKDVVEHMSTGSLK